MAKTGRSRHPAPQLSARRLEQMAIERGVLVAKVVSPSEVETGSWVAWKCRYGCDCYGSSLVCPPHTPSPAETRRMLDEYSRAILFEAPLGEVKKIAVALERDLFLCGHYKALGLGAGPCELCDGCAFEDGCRHPTQARPAMEACGIDVFATVRKQGLPLEVAQTRTAPQHYYGLVLVE